MQVDQEWKLEDYEGSWLQVLETHFNLHRKGTIWKNIK